MSDHIVPVRTYLLIFLALMAGTVVTVLAAHHNFGVWNAPIALAIAVVKAVLVILFFMHVKYSSRLTQLVVASGFFFLLILFGITLLDYVARGSVNPETRPAGILQVDDK